MKLPLWPPITPTGEYGIFTDLLKEIPEPKAQEARKNQWILEKMWKLVDTNVYMR